MDMDAAYLVKVLEAAGHSFSDDQVALFLLFLHNVERFGSALGLTDAKGAILVEDHLMDSLLILPCLHEMSVRSLCDVGSGAGFPGIALAIALPDVSVTLVERMTKRARFLQMTALKLNLPNLKVVEASAPLAGLVVDAVVFRALSQMSTKLVKSLLPMAPMLLAYKGTLHLAQAECDELSASGYDCQLLPLRSVKERHLLVIKPKA
jgi:16S rRNA (guanine527-N7)-methyltransferase